MTWQEIRKKHPRNYVLLKNYHWKQKGDIITILDGEILFNSADSKEIYHHYRSLKTKETVIFGYTGWEKFEVEERPFIGIRPAHE